ncbi:MAG: diphthine--ammonia ligase [Candidatus Bathyarchaeota archaeon]|nr:diphthine--ammonia ligase [Candidatus Bathyarchaeota archaeon]
MRGRKEEILKKLVAAWSGGKDSCFACYKAIQQGHKVSHLLTMMSDLSKSNFHLVHSEMLDAQSQALEIPIVKRTTTPDSYELEFKRALLQMRAKGVEGIVTGDVYDVALHETGWLERICKEAGLIPVKPLWHLDTQRILTEFIRVGFKATVVRLRTDVFGIDWLGRELNMGFLDDLLKLGSVDPCGENGEFHTFVIDGPLFKKRIEIIETEKVKLNGNGRLVVKRFEVRSKRS